ncbi:hypothetical protein J2Y55_005839 [Bosea sp. BE125]|uniref:class I SAM-dependent methyltransferase n=1 Tax=Bosea sp. BE125 TaxID=2817909 RepID=UPI0028546F15|nr:class I SAM-dependent methyltransferase [Bosea sp. BE125]MDR6874801.1 hypothetical protein [Bosea sp. BE125]
MLENYAKDENGVIYQIQREPYVYDINYTANSYGTADRNHRHAEMSHLRFGYVCGSIGRIPKSILDVGYGSGDFLKVAKLMVPEAYGNDIPPAYPLDGIEIIEDIYSREFDVVTFFDCLEHFEDPYQIRSLQTNFVCVTMPWCHHHSVEWFSNWKHRKPNEHLWHFNKESLAAFFDSIGFDTVNICNIEDTIRKSQENDPNIIAGTFRKRS